MECNVKNLSAGFQFLYTSVFGFYSAFLFIRTGKYHFFHLQTGCIKIFITTIFWFVIVTYIRLKLLYCLLFPHIIFLIFSTGHFLPLFAVHAFCNHMGLPEMKEMLSKPTPVRNKLMAFHVLGLVAWYFLLYPLTEPSLYSNSLYVLWS